MQDFWSAGLSPCFVRAPRVANTDERLTIITTRDARSPRNVHISFAHCEAARAMHEEIVACGSAGTQMQVVTVDHRVD